MYRVAKGHSFIGRGVSYKPGDEITESAFSKREDFLRNVKNGCIVFVQTEETPPPTDEPKQESGSPQERPAPESKTTQDVELTPESAVPKGKKKPALRKLANTDLERTLEDPLGAGTPFRLIPPDGLEFDVIGSVGDVSLLIKPETGETVRSRSIECVYRLGATPTIPVRGWRAIITGLDGQALSLFVQGVDIDRTLGVCRLTMGVNMETLDARGDSKNHEAD
jgi:hypothetical protein